MSSDKNLIKCTVEEAIQILDKLTSKNVTVSYLKQGTAGCSYYKITFDVDGKPSTFSIKFSKENLKISPQAITENGPSKVKCTFFVNETKLGELFKKFEELVVPAVRVKLPVEIYPSMIKLIQTHSSEKSSNGEEKIVEISKPLGWISLPYMTSPSNNKFNYQGKITIAGVGEGPIALTSPKYEEITKFWSRRALVTGNIVLDNLLVMKSKQIYLTMSFNTFNTIIALPIIVKEEDTTADVEELTAYAINNNIPTGITEKPIENTSEIFDADDFKEEPN